MKFEELSLDTKTLAAVRSLGYEAPTPVQEQVIPIALSGKDVLAQSCTGSGKTAAFSIPFAEKITPGAGLQALVLAPTRELCIQITRDMEDMTRNRGLKVVSVYGGQSIDIQLKRVGKADIIIATPGRLLDHLRRKTINIGKIKFLVLDEADRMLDMGFIDDIRKIIRATPPDRQTMLFSATIPKPILRLIEKYMKDPEHVEITSEMDRPDIDEVFYQVNEKEKFQTLLYIIDCEVPESAMIFCNTKHLTDNLAENLKHHGADAKAIHGDLKQSKRERVIKGFYEKDYPILVATDVASRGLDIDDVSHIINYDVPQDAEDYTHRIGRTARMGKKGKAITLLSESGHQDMRNFERFHGYVEFTPIEGFQAEAYPPINPRLRSKDRIRSGGKKGGRRPARGRGGFRGRPRGGRRRY